MKRLLISALILLLALPFLTGQNFAKWFGTGALRVNLVMAGNAESSEYFLGKIFHEPYFSGNPNQLIDPFNYGDHKFCVYDKASGELIYSQTFCTLFFEWQTTGDAAVNRRAFSYAARFPQPLHPVILEISDRKADGVFEKKFSAEIDPASWDIEPFRSAGYELKDIRINGAPDHKVDLLMLAEGYTADEMEKFFADAERMTNAIFSEEPFASRKQDFNVRALASVSEESGTDLPGKGIWKNTILNTRYYTFGSERYLTTDDFIRVAELSAEAPCDHVLILVNSAKYGGGGIYNFYSLAAVDDKLSEPVLKHEFGHGFAGLGDEYYESDVAYESYFPLDVEPWNPNLTTLVDFARKWKNMVPAGVPVPTPLTPEYKDGVGVFEGGGYVAKGVYRPVNYCRMRVNNAVFCPVCSRAIEDMIFRYTR
ncbi:MAG: M64 family metallopeptidase [Bacteroidota bacterium]